MVPRGCIPVHPSLPAVYENFSCSSSISALGIIVHFFVQSFQKASNDVIPVCDPGL